MGEQVNSAHTNSDSNKSIISNDDQSLSSEDVSETVQTTKKLGLNGFPTAADDSTIQQKCSEAPPKGEFEFMTIGMRVKIHHGTYKGNYGIIRGTTTKKVIVDIEGDNRSDSKKYLMKTSVTQADGDKCGEDLFMESASRFKGAPDSLESSEDSILNNNDLPDDSQIGKCIPMKLPS